MASVNISFPSEWATKQADGDAEWWTKANYVDVDLSTDYALMLTKIVGYKVHRIQRFEHPAMWRDYAIYCKTVLSFSSVNKQLNEQFLFFGTRATTVEEALSHPGGLDPRFSIGGFYGHGVYLSVDAAYVANGPYAYRVPESGGTRLKILVVRAALGTCQEMGQRIDDITKNMKMPGVRLEGPPRVLYDSVRAGPHRPYQSGPGQDDSIIYVVYNNRQLYPAYVVEIELPVEQLSHSTPPGASPGAPPSVPVDIDNVTLMYAAKKFSPDDKHQGLDALLHRWKSEPGVNPPEGQIRELRELIGRDVLWKTLCYVFSPMALEQLERRIKERSGGRPPDPGEAGTPSVPKRKR